MSEEPVDERRISRRKLIKRALWGLAGLSAIDALLIEPRWLEFVQVEIPIRNLPSDFDGYRIAHLSDVHYLRGVDKDFVHQAISLANGFRPDLFAITGDFCDHAATATVPNLKGLFDPYQARDGFVAVLGNHDHWLDAEGVRRELTKNTPVRLIENESRLIERGNGAILIAGIGDLWEGKIDPQKAFWGRDPSIPRIMLQHNPDFAEEMRRFHPTTWCDLQLAGHTHGGQVRIPFGPAPVVPSRYGNKFRSGLVRGRSHLVYVNRGLTSLRRPRFFCRPEVTGITLRRAKEEGTA